MQNGNKRLNEVQRELERLRIKSEIDRYDRMYGVLVLSGTIATTFLTVFYHLYESLVFFSMTLFVWIPYLIGYILGSTIMRADSYLSMNLRILGWFLFLSSMFSLATLWTFESPAYFIKAFAERLYPDSGGFLLIILASTYAIMLIFFVTVMQFIKEKYDHLFSLLNPKRGASHFVWISFFIYLIVGYLFAVSQGDIIQGNTVFLSIGAVLYALIILMLDSLTLVKIIKNLIGKPSKVRQLSGYMLVMCIGIVTTWNIWVRSIGFISTGLVGELIGLVYIQVFISLFVLMLYLQF
jgi:hypothetical protein